MVSSADEELLNTTAFAARGRTIAEQVASVLWWAGGSHPRTTVSWPAFAHAVFGIIGVDQVRAIRDCIQEAAFLLLIQDGISTRHDDMGARVLIDAEDENAWRSVQQTRRRALRGLLRGDSRRWSQSRKATMLTTMWEAFPEAQRHCDTDEKVFWTKVFDIQAAHRAEMARSTHALANAWLNDIGSRKNAR